MWRMIERMAKGEAARDEVAMLREGTTEIKGHTNGAFGGGAGGTVKS